MPFEITATPVTAQTPEGGRPASHRLYWWRDRDLMADPRFRVLDPVLFWSVACLTVPEMKELQERFRPAPSALIPHWAEDSGRFDQELAGMHRWGLLWVVQVMEVVGHMEIAEFEVN